MKQSECSREALDCSLCRRVGRREAASCTAKPTPKLAGQWHREAAHPPGHMTEIVPSATGSRCRLGGHATGRVSRGWLEWADIGGEGWLGEERGASRTRKRAAHAGISVPSADLGLQNGDE